MNEKMKIIEKVVKLLSLSEGTSHSEEAKTAKEMAASLMAKHQIKVSDLKEEEPFLVKTDQLNRKSPKKYDMFLRDFISSYNGVKLLIRKGKTVHGSYLYIGRKVDVECFLYMLDVVLQQREVAWKNHLKELQQKLGFKLQRKAYAEEKKAWHFGFAYGIKDKLNELKEMENRKVQEYGLVPVDSAEQAFHWYKEQNEVKDSRKTKIRRLSQEGYDSGKSTSIHTGIQKQKGVKRLN